MAEETKKKESKAKAGKSVKEKTADTVEKAASKSASKRSTSSKSKKVDLKVPAKSYYGTGKRKTSIAKVWLFPGSGNVVVNGKSEDDYFSNKVLVKGINKPLELLKLQGKYDCVIRASGGGISGQAGATQLGIARALLALNLEFRGSLKKAGLLTRDDRIKERKKYGRKRARKGFQYRKR